MLVFDLLLIASFYCHMYYAAPIGTGGEPQPKRSKSDTGPRCKLRFSEIKLGWKPGSEINPFVELKTNCEKRPGPIPKNALSSYTMIVLQSEPVSLVMIVSFQHFSCDGTQPYVVIGSPEVTNLDISVSTPHIQSIFSRTEAKNMLPNSGHRPYALLLLYDLTKLETKSLNLIYNPTGELTSRVLTTDEIKFIKRRTVDMVVLVGEDPLQTRDFEYFWPQNGRSMLSDLFNAVKSAADNMGLSNCAEDMDGFNAEAFEIQPQTPGEPNICQQADSEMAQIEENTCPAELKDRALIHSISEEELLNLKTHHFRPEWIQRCKHKFPIRSTILQDQAVQTWINFNEAGEDLGCQFTCKACKTYLNLGFRPDIKNKPNVLTSGYNSNNIYENGEAIRVHLKYPLHLEAMEFFEKMRQATDLNEAKKILKESEDKEIEVFNATMNVVLIVYAENKAGLSFQAHSTMMNAIRKTGANVGTLQHSSDASQGITKIIANSFHNQLLAHLVSKNEPFSIMIDSSTSFNSPFLSVYIQVLEDGFPVTHFYRLIHMSQGEKAEPMMNSLIDQIQSDDQHVTGFEHYFKSQIVSFSSDGASVIVGKNKSFKVFLQKYVGRTVPNIICLAHRLDTSYKKGLMPKKETLEALDKKKSEDVIKRWQYSYFESFEKSSNELYNFYNSRGYKRWNHFLQTAEELGIDPKRYRHVLAIRWSESHMLALLTVHHNYYIVTEDCDRIRLDEDFEDHVREKASDHYERMTDKTFMVVLHEFLDILTSFKKASKKFQEDSSIVVAKIETVHDVLNEVEEYRDSFGSWMKDFLKSVACLGKCDEGLCTMEMYDSCEEVIINGLILQNNFPVILPYSNVRLNFYENMVKSIKKYMNTTLLESYEVFNPSRIAFERRPAEETETLLDDLYTTSTTLHKYREHQTFSDRFRYVCKFYEFQLNDCIQMEKEWKTLIQCFITSENHLDPRDDASRFWPLAKELCKELWSPNLSRLINSVLVTPFTSSQVERGFSVMNNVKTKMRSRMDRETLNAAMTVKINGPEIEDFNTYKYTVEVLKHMARADDDKMKGGRPRNEVSLPGYFDRSRIYHR